MSSLPAQPLSPLDGRYRAAVTGLADYLSEAGLNRARVEVEVEWIILLTDRALFGSAPLSDAQKESLRSLYRDFGQAEIDWLAEKEAVTRHDVKAIEYLVRDRLSTLGLDAIAELTHFACAYVFVELPPVSERFRGLVNCLLVVKSSFHPVLQIMFFARNK